MDNIKFEEIYNKYSNHVYQTAYSFLKDKDLSKDIVQETFIKLLKYNKKFNDEQHQKNWLLRVCVNLSIDTLRKNKRIIHADEYIHSLKDEKTILSQYDFINHLVNNLPLKYRSVIILYYYEDYKIKEISKILNLNESTIKMRLLRGKQKLIEMEKQYDQR